MTTKIFIAIDDQEHSGYAVDKAIEIARISASQLIFFMANPAVLPGRGPVVHRWTKDYIDGYFNNARSRSRQSGVYDTIFVTKNAVDVETAILAEAKSVEADYIVVGSNCAPRLLGDWRHSISRVVAMKAHCPTIIVHNL